MSAGYTGATMFHFGKFYLVWRTSTKGNETDSHVIVLEISSPERILVVRSVWELRERQLVICWK